MYVFRWTAIVATVFFFVPHLFKYGLDTFFTLQFPVIKQLSKAFVPTISLESLLDHLFTTQVTSFRCILRAFLSFPLSLYEKNSCSFWFSCLSHSIHTHAPCNYDHHFPFILSFFVLAQISIEGSAHFFSTSTCSLNVSQL